MHPAKLCSYRVYLVCRYHKSTMHPEIRMPKQFYLICNFLRSSCALINFTIKEQVEVPKRKNININIVYTLT
jgi:hypothetical protein